MIPKLERVRMPLAKLKPHPDNAKERTITPEARSGLRASLTTFGEVHGVVWNRRTGFVISGHQRLGILEAEGEREVDVTVVDLSDEEEALLRATLNNQAIQGRSTDAVGELLEQLSSGREALLKELRLDILLPKAADEIPVTHIPTGKVHDRFMITISGDVPDQADVLQRLVSSLRDLKLESVEIGLVLNKRG